MLCLGPSQILMCASHREISQIPCQRVRGGAQDAAFLPGTYCLRGCGSSDQAQGCISRPAASLPSPPSPGHSEEQIGVISHIKDVAFGNQGPGAGPQAFSPLSLGRGVPDAAPRAAQETSLKTSEHRCAVSSPPPRSVGTARPGLLLPTPALLLVLQSNLPGQDTVAPRSPGFPRSCPRVSLSYPPGGWAGSSLSQDPRGQGAAPWSVWGTCEHTQPGLGRGPELHFPQEVACCSKALGFGRTLPVSKAMRFVVSACSMRWGAYWMLGGGGYSELPDRQGRDAPQPCLPPQHEPRTGCAACPPPPGPGRAAQ